ncbi:uncharacterized protein EV422DRAFT_617920 [Fimicolochytrium jonesii]|uniref:uncharacterized protein n=1 Tax=Fimicolochytrium jonesii TaxID=1396493 RepID=UPI0022FDD77A|nr:uncharacterized protein EV422DRAFT_617920 [Fimicolochytrium jonesii]KAI8824214.1 hypothetical protein EV422DRAFT_617920 [Fimicolochytrium jonesii]
MKSQVILSVVAAIASASSVAGHGFLVGIGALGPNSKGQTRNYQAIDNNIDSLRNPTTGSTPFCRTSTKSARVPLHLTEGGKLTVTQAFSVGAQHIGPCAVEIWDPKTNKKFTLTSVAGPNGCARVPIAQSDSNKKSGANNQCPGRLPNKLVTNDMCLNKWTFTTRNVNAITCKDCILRWTWVGQHVSPAEKYESCIDVTVTKGSSGKGKGSVADDGTVVTDDETPVTDAPTESLANIDAGAKAAAPAPAPVDAATNGKCTSGSYMVCNGTGFLVCYPEDASKSAVARECAAGTTCSPFGKYIHCK